MHDVLRECRAGQCYHWYGQKLPFETSPEDEEMRLALHARAGGRVTSECKYIPVWLQLAVVIEMKLLGAS